MGKDLFGRLEAEVNAREETAGLSMADILDLPNPPRELINWIIRQAEVGLAQAAAQLGQDEPSASKTLNALLDKGYLYEIEVKGERHFRVCLLSKRKQSMPSNLWKALEDKPDQTDQ